MQFLSIRARGLGPFREERFVDLRALDGKLTAITGANGAGKSTLLELLLGALYRDCPTRGPLLNLATARDAFVEVELALGGHEYKIRQYIDAVSRKGETSILRDGEPAIASSKVSAAEAFIEKNFPPLDVLLVSSFCAQQSRGFLEAKPAERKSLLLRMLGVEKIEDLAARARTHALATKGQVESLRRRAQDEWERFGEVKAAEDRARGFSEAYATARERLAQAETALREGRDRQATRNARLLEQQHWVDRTTELKRQIEAIDRRAKASREKITEAQSILGRRAAIEKALATKATLDAEDQAIRDELSRLAAAEQALRDRRAAISKELETVTAKRTEATKAVAGYDAAKKATDELPELEAALVQARADIAAHRAQLDELQGQSLLGAEGRIVKLRTGLEEIRDHNFTYAGGVANNMAKDTLEADDQAASAAVEVPKRIATAKANLALLQKEEREIEAGVVKLRERAERLPLLARLKAESETLQVRLNELTTSKNEINEGFRAIHAEGEQLAGRERQAARARRGIADDLSAAPLLERAEATIEAHKEQIDECARDRERAAGGLEALGKCPAGIDAVDLAKLEAERKTALDLVDSSGKAFARSETELLNAKQGARRIAELNAECAQAELDHADWTKLALDLGRDGVQAAISDSALPELVALTNSLLHTAFGPRFTVDIRSQAADAKGKRMLETLDVVVIDSRAGREAEAETFSGGEVAIIGEGLSLALTILACRASGVVRPTLVRDEAGAALDPVNGRAWVSMLRRAVDMIGADRLLFVSHAEEISSLADSRIAL